MLGRKEEQHVVFSSLGRVHSIFVMFQGEHHWEGEVREGEGDGGKVAKPREGGGKRG